jgi:lipopolysaccharide export system protein LptA
MKSLPALAALTLLAAAAAPASAQLAQGKGPVDVAADSQDYTNSQCVNVWHGNVEALQGDARLRTDLLKAFFEPKSKGGSANNSCGDLIRMEAQGSIYYVTPQQRVHGDNAVYEATNDTLTLTGDVVAVQGQNVIRGTRMVINTKTGEGHMVGAATGRNAPNRVRGVFYPKDNNANSPPAPAGKPR